MEKQRDYYMDNAKMILIFLVVIAHLCAFNSDARDFIYLFIYSFHMPAFLFVCGYFSQKSNTINNIKRLLIPYLILQVIWFVFYANVLDIHQEFTFLIPAYSLWFLLTLFFMKQILPIISKIKYCLPILFIIGIFAGYITHINSFLSLSRFIVFLPFFYMGYKFKKDEFLKFTNKYSVRILAFAGFITLALLLYAIKDIIKPELFYAKLPYEFMQYSLPFDIVVLRIFSYMYTIAIGICFFAMIPRTKNFLSYIGGVTIGIYIIHPFIVRILKNSDFYKQINTPIEMVLCVLLAITITIILSNKYINNFIGLIFKVPIDKLFKK